MIVNSTKHVDLPDGVYMGFWCGWVVTVPMLEGDLEFPVSRTTPSVDALAIRLNVDSNKFSFETKLLD
jgi:hypothetical protein